MKRIIIALGLISLGGALCLANSTYTVTVTVAIDNTADLILQGNTLSWSLLSDFAPGGVCATVNSNGTCATTGTVSEKDYAGNSVSPNDPLIVVQGTDSSNAGEDFGSGWYDGIQGFACTSDGSAGAQAKLPCPYTPPNTFGTFNFVLPFSLVDLVGPVTLTVLECGGDAGSTCPFLSGDIGPLLIQPTAGNGEKATVAFDDAQQGVHDYEVELTFTESPEPGTAALGALGLLALGLIARNRRQSRVS